ncbi:probable 3-oxoacyl-[acyl-carrier-protein]-reductase (oar-1) [Claviceps purpurea 20.1]|uniref:Probable 3-oxoacyl-[acyl-carrier-protein]-reductase (Oar-1) n=1 Tax=Claviceps purpurea (strain 20.1) TaxID=1111077 RepID=M1W1I9_CLAP2|nr:probable 3-oxoacyl-[acyl-carrier-protein]-reductase (oar-1) [Claviceps purpurea 20.1]
MSISPLLAGKHAVVLGATGIIGSHIARAFAFHGAVVTLLGRSAVQARAKLEPQMQAYRRDSADTEGPSAHRFIRLDVADRPSIKDVFGPRATEDGSPSVGAMDILVNCAGIAQTTLLKRTSDDALASILETNLLATMLACKHARVRQNGCIINVSSLMAVKAGLGVTAYAASKAGVVAFTRALCLEMAARSVRVNALLPGWVESAMWNNLKPELKETYLGGIPSNRVAHPAEVADAAVFLATNGYANNCVLNLDVIVNDNGTYTILHEEGLPAQVRYGDGVEIDDVNFAKAVKTRLLSSSRQDFQFMVNMNIHLYHVKLSGELNSTWGSLEDFIFRAIQLGGPPGSPRNVVESFEHARSATRKFSLRPSQGLGSASGKPLLVQDHPT